MKKPAGVDDAIAEWRKNVNAAHTRRVRISIRKERMYELIKKIADPNVGRNEFDAMLGEWTTEARAIVSEVERADKD